MGGGGRGGGVAIGSGRRALRGIGGKGGVGWILREGGGGGRQFSVYPFIVNGIDAVPITLGVFLAKFLKEDDGDDEVRHSGDDMIEGIVGSVI